MIEPIWIRVNKIVREMACRVLGHDVAVSFPSAWCKRCRHTWRAP